MLPHAAVISSECRVRVFKKLLLPEWTFAAISAEAAASKYKTKLHHYGHRTCSVCRSS